MEHVVFYPSVDNLPAFRRLDSLDEAVRFVEHLRNVEGVSDCSVHALTPVPVSFRAYYRAEVPAEQSAELPAEQSAQQPATASPAAGSDPAFAELGEAQVSDEAAAEEPSDLARVEVPAPTEPVAAETSTTELGEAKTLGFFAR